MLESVAFMLGVASVSASAARSASLKYGVSHHAATVWMRSLARRVRDPLTKLRREVP